MVVGIGGGQVDWLTQIVGLRIHPLKSAGGEDEVVAHIDWRHTLACQANVGARRVQSLDLEAHVLKETVGTCGP